GWRQLVAPLRASLRPSGRAAPAPGAFGAQRRVVGLRDGARPRLAPDALRAVLRRRRDLLGLRYGAGAGPADAALLQAARVHPGKAPRRDGQAHPGHGPGADLLLHLRDLHLALQRRAHREGVALLEGDADLRVGALDHVLL